ncbi:class I SAM-dependent methyltransferase [Alkalisalibacterium limincola]|uniref:Class I SAM-dependent methyltransferase n=1 Tax=Alkalisalibacterium limincola TaxID=2699169 RepID=A0A5C8KS78_9GAMM|nr:class I SAM-dependent methyltransferase [Alkalisalibacterium limincola]TXK62284.1 class I SAM-dependent methyltransferase [Alkalisalibacterium limincola]
MSSGFLHRYFLNNSGKRLHKWVHYFDVYERHFERFRGTAPTVLEIGVHGGGSMEMWKAYFGEGARIVGLDINPECKQHERENIEVFIGSQDDPAVIGTILDKYPEFDIVIDDGSHRMSHLIASFELLYPHVRDNGVYFVEDLHTCYWPKYEGGLGLPHTFIEYAKRKIDQLNAVHAPEDLQVDDFSRSTDSIAFYDSIAVFEKRRQGHRQAIITKPLD